MRSTWASMASAQGRSRHHECAMCMEIFTSPRLLPCFHTFCLGCIKQLVQTQPGSRSFPCPTCRTPIAIPVGGVEKFQVNFYIEAEVESQHAGSSTQARVCEMCQKNSVTHKCADCDQYACDVCTAIHASIAATRSHTVLSLQGAGQGGAKVTKYRYCATHTDEKIRFFCNKCSTVVCRDCKLTSHEGHPTIELSAKSSQASQIIQQVTKQARENLEPKLRKQVKEAEHHQKNLQVRKREILVLLEKRAAELKQEVDKSLSQAKSRLEQETGGVDKTVAMCVDAMNMELAGFLSLTEHAERVVKGGCEADILEMPRLMTHFFGDDGERLASPSVQPLQPKSRKRGNIVSQHRGDIPCKLKSFTESKWKAAIQMEEETTECVSCHSRYDKKGASCPSCGRASRVPSGYNTRCGNCGNVYAQNYQRCPHCGSAARSDDTKATMQKAVPDYIGRVVTSEPVEEDPNAKAAGFSFYGGGYGGYGGYGPQQTRQTTRTAKGVLTGQICDDISAIQSHLLQWQGQF